MRDMTEEEYEELDRRLTDTVPTLGHNGTGFFSRKGFQVVDIDENTEKNPQYENNWHTSNK
jgi:hypothetical protein